jgi:hypothetical protein
MEGGAGFEPAHGDFADHSVSLFAIRPCNSALSRTNYYNNFRLLLQGKVFYMVFKVKALLRVTLY